MSDLQFSAGWRAGLGHVPRKLISLTPPDGETAGVRGQPPTTTAANTSCCRPSPALYRSRRDEMNSDPDKATQQGQHGSPLADQRHGTGEFAEKTILKGTNAAL